MYTYIKNEIFVQDPSDVVENIGSKIFEKLCGEIAKKDIKCYKVLRKRMNGEAYYYTPISNMHVKKSVLQGEELMTSDTTPIITIDHRKYPNTAAEIVCGYVQCFTNKEDAEVYCDDLKKKHGYECVIFECEIPKTILYFKGTDRNGLAVYEAKAIKIIG